MANLPPQPPAVERAKKSDDVGVRVTDAKQSAAAAEAEFAALSATKLALLKQLPISRLTRLGPDPDLTKADAAELRSWLADRTGSSMRKPGGSPMNILIRRRRRLPRLRASTIGVTVLLTLVGLLTAAVRTPSSFDRLESAAMYAIQLSDGSSQNITLPPETVVIRNGKNNGGRLIEGRYWVAGHGYQLVMFIAQP
jgi:hypothetical protein